MEYEKDDYAYYFGYQRDRKWADKFIPAIKKAIIPHLQGAILDSLERENDSDLVAFKSGQLTVFARVRRDSYYVRYPNQFTLRSHRKSGAKTELERIIAGEGRYYFYGFAKPKSRGNLVAWYLIDLDAFREHLTRGMFWIRSGTGKNGDGTEFQWFDIGAFPDDLPILVASSLPKPTKMKLTFTDEDLRGPRACRRGDRRFPLIT